MPRIHLLDREVANQIAAGEVVERPASVIKELLENSLDADAKHINVRILQGGIREMMIRDDGCGMDQEDCLLAVEAHATSKLQKIEDLNSLTTLGFRGEALASIASVSKLRINSRVRGAEIGTSVYVEAGELIEHVPVSCPAGTCIWVKDLFYNTPARYKFLKKDRAETAKISRVVSELALAYPDVAFSLQSGQEQLVKSPGNGDLKAAIFSILGSSIYDRMIPVLSDENESVQVKGFIAAPDMARKSRVSQFVFVNGRAISSPIILRAVEDAYRDFLVKGLYPMYVIHLELPLAYLDVNVHPQKLEVRFWNDHSVYRAVFRQIQNSLRAQLQSMHQAQNKASHVLSQSSFKAKPLTPLASETLFEQIHRKVEKGEETSPFSKQSFLGRNLGQAQVLPQKQPLQTNPEEPEGSAKRNSTSIPSTHKDTANLPKDDWFEVSWIETDPESTIDPASQSSDTAFSNRAEGLFSEGESQAELISDAASAYISEDLNMRQSQACVVSNFSLIHTDDQLSVPMEGGMEGPIEKLAKARYVGHLFHTYLIFENGEECYLLDQHAAHEKILYERFCDRWEKKTLDEPILQQNLLIPIDLTLQTQTALFCQEQAELFAQLGYLYEIKDKELRLKAVPAETIMGGRSSHYSQGKAQSYHELAKRFEEMVDDLAQDALLYARQEAQKTQLMLATLACKAAVKAHDPLTEEEVKDMVKALLELKNPYHCPHGRPTIVARTRSDLDKAFQRIVH